MFRKMRLAENQVTEEQAVEVLQAASYGTLALAGDDGYPYALPVNFVYSDNKIYFHGATEGQKVDAIRRCDKVSFCAVTKADIIADQFNCLYLSTIAFGRAHIITDQQEKQKVLELIIEKYSSEFMEGGKKYIKTTWDDVQTYVIEIEHITGKKGTP